MCGFRLVSSHLLRLLAAVAQSMSMSMSTSKFPPSQYRITCALWWLAFCQHGHILRLTFHFNELIITERRRLCSVMRTRTVAVISCASLNQNRWRCLSDFLSVCACLYGGMGVRGCVGVCIVIDVDFGCHTPSASLRRIMIMACLFV